MIRNRIRAARPVVSLAVSLVVLALGCGSRHAAGRQENAEIPLHWEIGWIDSLGDLPADEFLFLPGDRVRPGPAVGTVPGGGFVATIDTAIARRLIFRETALLIATRYSRAQQLELERVVRAALADPAALDTLWAWREVTIRRLEGATAPQDRAADRRHRLLTRREAVMLRSLPLSAWYHLEDVPRIRAEGTCPPRFFLADLIELRRQADGDIGLPAAMSIEVFADTTIPFSSRLEYSREITRAVGDALPELREPIDVDSLGAHTARHLAAAYERLHHDHRLPTRYHWFDDPDAPGNPMH